MRFGPLEGVEVGQMWDSRFVRSDLALVRTWTNVARVCHRADLARDRVHPSLEKVIYGDVDGARSIVMSRGYEDDEDKGEVM